MDTQTVLSFVFAILVPYLICSINPAIAVTKIKSGKDIRTLGSKNPGLTNTLRTQGKVAAIIVLLFDVSKGIISILATIAFTEHLTNSGGLLCDGATVACVWRNGEIFIWLATLFAVFGHCYPIWHKFKGGKAVLVTITTLFVIDWVVAAFLLLIFIIIVAITRYVSLGSVIAALLYPFAIFASDNWLDGFALVETPHRFTFVGMIYSATIAIIIIYKHVTNIERLINKTEKKLGKSERDGLVEEKT
ncbi:MAG: glycerol-3-phosphate 1-O-acyltransferase PlsY [Oscillospiraceae bacterium]|nr:glycerol-3-phosphate 1-O-acyltransferase PlsY [Oscillospiraceae bacterium]